MRISYARQTGDLLGDGEMVAMLRIFVRHEDGRDLVPTFCRAAPEAGKYASFVRSEAVEEARVLLGDRMAFTVESAPVVDLDERQRNRAAGVILLCLLSGIVGAWVVGGGSDGGKAASGPRAAAPVHPRVTEGDLQREVWDYSREELLNRFLRREIAPRARAELMFIRAQDFALREAIPAAVLYEEHEMIDSDGHLNRARVEAERLRELFTPEEQAEACDEFGRDRADRAILIERLRSRYRQ